MIKRQYDKVFDSAFETCKDCMGKYSQTDSRDRDDRIASIENHLINYDAVWNEALGHVFKDAYLYNAMIVEGVNLNDILSMDEYLKMDIDTKIEWFNTIYNKEKIDE